MVRVYKRKTEKGRWDEDEVQKALQEIRDKKLSTRQAAFKYQIPRTTLLSRIQRGINYKVINKGRYKPVLNAKMEEELKLHVIHLEKLFYGLCVTDLRRLAFEFAEINGISHSFNKTRRMAGKDWCSGFMKRQGDLSIRRPEATSLARVTGFSKESVNRFFDLLKQLMDKHKFSADKIFNCDETGISTVQKPRKIIAERGRKQVRRITSLERGRNITMLACVSALGTFIPPFLVYPRVRMNPQLLTGSMNGTVAYANPSGWMDSSLFLKFIEHLVNCVHPTKDNPILLILDGHASHKSIEAIELARKSGIIMITFPPHTTHKLQALDISVFGPFKHYMSKGIDLWMTNHHGSRITDYDLAPILKDAFLSAVTPNNITQGFKKAGIFPLCPDVFNETDFEASKCLSQQNESEDVREILDQSRNHVTETLTSDILHLAPSTSTHNVSHLMNIEESEVRSSESGTSSDKQNVPMANTNSNSTSVDYVPVYKISPIPKKRNNEGGKKRKINRESSQVITSSPYKQQLEKKLTSKAPKTKSKNACSSKPCKRQLLPEPKKSLTSERRDEGDDTPCLYCGERYGDTNIEQWIMCMKCQQWMHEDCTDNEAGEDNFVCDICR
ncbi:hypothetical protein ANN_26942 [Periplaneta americana]|uniref:Uncharacterized protein n=1 Tax=Periplaneta americana TaxID=6978 RepID=A0ABQ8RWM7_PERAM|nr:hypothetical protein ANN_26942 [Periplaneta americana]